MISSEDSAAAIRRAYELGVTDYISRPFDAQVVYRRVMNILAHDLYLSAFLQVLRPG